MDISQWSKDLGLMKSNMEKVGSSSNTSSNSTSSRSLDETRTTNPAKQKSLNCPRCNSKNTKFCYYNNYSLTQPRYFCKTCRRYWTEGGSLRNVPVGGGSRKNKKSTTVSPPSTSISLPNMVSRSNTTSSASKFSVDGTNHDLNLAFSPVQPPDFTGTSSITTPFIPIMMNSVPSMSFGMQDLRSNVLGCPLDFISGADQGENSDGRLLFTFDEARRMNYTSGHVNGDDDHNQQEQNKLYEQNGGGDRHYFWNDLISGSDD